MASRESLPSVDAWTRARERYTQDLSDQEQKLYAEATAESIFYDASAAEKTHRAGSSARYFATEKLRPLADAIEAYGKAIDVYANTYSLVLCPLWGSIRVVLHVSTLHRSPMNAKDLDGARGDASRSWQGVFVVVIELISYNAIDELEDMLLNLTHLLLDRTRIWRILR